VPSIQMRAGKRKTALRDEAKMSADNLPLEKARRVDDAEDVGVLVEREQGGETKKYA